MFRLLFRLITLPFRLVALAVRVLLIPIRLAVGLTRRAVGLVADLVYGVWRVAFRAVGAVFATFGLLLGVLWFGVRSILKVALFPLRIVGIGRRRKKAVTEVVA